jgi:hypothetical protein
LPNRRTLRLNKYQISTDKYQELFYFCKQYWDREEEIKHLRGLTEVVMDGMPKGNTTSDPTARKAIMIDRLRKENELIEQTAIEADSYIYQDLIKNITQGITYEYLDCCCSRGYFYDRRRKFFKLLSEKR